MSRPAPRCQYSNTQSQLNLPALERAILDYWRDDETFLASIAQRRSDGSAPFVFYDGPPFANGLPHYGHLLTGFVKDAIPRYKTMTGHVVERRFGWDCHGLPAEMAIERDLGLSGRVEIEAYGIGRFNEACQALVNSTSSDWDYFVSRQARWVDFDNSYRTMDISFMESVMWAFHRLWERGLLYESYRVLPYCWECETPLSNFETRQDDSYRPRTDPSVTVAFTLHADTSAPEPLGGELKMLAWTTTPWTLPSNLALAVSPDINYAVFDSAGSRYVMAEARLSDHAELFPDAQVVAVVPGTAFLARRFTPLFPFFSDTANAFVVVGGDFVTVEEGTGIVQMAPGFGEEDQMACAEANIPVVCPVDEKGCYTHEVPWYEGTQVFEANPAIIEYLKEQGVLVTQQDYEHSYPHCWRTDTPLIYRAVSSWFVNVSKIKTELMARNKEIDWIPDHVKDGAFGHWLAGARDWSITRNRYWGSPIPVWKSTDPSYPRIDVYGSLDELERDFGVRPTNLHRPFIDELTRPNPDDPTGKSRMVRVSDVLDCWFESGSMPYGQAHYPFENQQSFEEGFPADFIVEYIGQTRGWFYTLHVLSVALFDQPPFRHCIAHGILLGDDGRKLSKRLKNYPDPREVFEEIGADAMRWFLLSSSVLRGQDMSLERSAIYDTVKRVINPIWNAYSFLTLYAHADDTTGEFASDSSNLLDRYVIARTAKLVNTVTDAFESFELSEATSAIEEFLDELTNWYIRRSRDRFWSRRGETAGGDADKQCAYNTLHTVLTVLTQLTAPLLPMLSEEIYRDLTKERSVHMTNWPKRDLLALDDSLVTRMDAVREICSAVHSVRKALGIRARQPLPNITVARRSATEDLSELVELIKAEVNVKEVVFTDDFEGYAKEVVQVLPRVIGPRLGDVTQRVIAAVRRGDYERVDDALLVAGERLSAHEFTLTLMPRNPATMRVISKGDAVVELDPTVDEALALEGIARDVIRVIQQLRRDAGFDVSDQITLHLGGAEIDSALAKSLAQFRDEIASQVLAVEVHLDHSHTPEDAARTTAQLHGADLLVAVARLD